MAPSWGESCWEARWPFVLSTSIVIVIHVCEASLQNCCCEVAPASRLGIIVGAYWREGTIYKQTNSVDFYNELGVIPEYHMTGLGTEYGRFAGEQRSLAYRGGGFDIAFDAVPTGNEGLYGHVSLGRNAYERLLTSANSLPLSRLIYNKVETTMGWKQESKHHWAAYAHFCLYQAQW